MMQKIVAFYLKNNFANLKKSYICNAQQSAAGVEAGVYYPNDGKRNNLFNCPCSLSGKRDRSSLFGLPSRRSNFKGFLFGVMWVEIIIDEYSIKAAVTELIRRGESPSLRNTKKLIREMVTANGEVWVTEPLFNDDSPYVIDWDKANMEAEKIAPKFYDKIF